MKLSLGPAWGRTQFTEAPRSLRSWLVPLLLGSLLALSACGGGDNANPGNGGGNNGGNPAVQPPASVAYDTPQPLYVVGEAITANKAQVTGGAVSAFTVTPALPSGLRLDAQTGEITGTPTAFQSQATYKVSASNTAGAASTELRLTITSRGQWTSVAAIPQGRHYFTVSRLQDGRVLAVGGFTSAGVSADARLYDPATRTWTAAAPALVARNGHTATVLPDGRVLVVGGALASRAATPTAEIYDPVTNTWTATGFLSESRENHTATLLANGQVLVVGGFDLSGTPTFRNTAERYDPATGTWTVLATRLAHARGQHAAELLPDGQTVLLAAGVNRLGFVTTAELLRGDDAGPTTTMPAQGGSGNVAQSVRLADGSVLVTTEGATAWRFHPATSAWTTGTLPNVRMQPTMTRLADGRVLLAGGTGTGGVRLRTADIYNPDVDVWTTASSMATARNAAAAALLNDGSVLVVGGFSGSGEVDAVEFFRP